MSTSITGQEVNNVIALGVKCSQFWNVFQDIAGVMLLQDTAGVVLLQDMAGVVLLEYSSKAPLVLHPPSPSAFSTMTLPNILKVRDWP